MKNKLILFCLLQVFKLKKKIKTWTRISLKIIDSTLIFKMFKCTNRVGHILSPALGGVF